MFTLPELPQTAADIARFGNLPSVMTSLVLSQIASSSKKPLIVITEDSLSAQKLRDELEFFLENKSTAITVFADREILPYDHFSPHHDLISERLALLARLPQMSNGIVIVALPTVMQLLPPTEFILKHSFVINKGDRIEPHAFNKRLIENGYHAVSQVMEHGEFAMRGSIIDLYPMGNALPFRIDLFDDEVDSIRTFDPETQLTLEKVTAINLLPAREFPLHEDAIAHFRQQWRKNFAGNPQNAPIYQAISSGKSYPGIENYLPLFFDELATFFDYLPENILLVRVGQLMQAATHFRNDVEGRFQQQNIDLTRPLLEPKHLYLAINDLFHRLNHYPSLELTAESVADKKGYFNFDAKPNPPLILKRTVKNPLSLLEEFLNQHNYRVLFTAESMGRREALLGLLAPFGIKPTIVQSYAEFLKYDVAHAICIAPLETGITMPAIQLAIVTEAELLGQHVVQGRKKLQQRIVDKDSLIKNLMELTIGDPIVHVDHGVGRYQGLQMLDVGETSEFLTILYADNDKIYVPVTNLHLVHRYTGPDKDTAPLTKLGTGQWHKIVQKAKERIRDVAAELLALHAKRAAKIGHAFTVDEAGYARFANDFPFEPTLDQEKAIQALMDDMQKQQAMDRLVCGDVGFGKTEVAMRAAFIAVTNNKQVAVLVPTTLLADQHFQTFSDRFAEWPVNVKVLSRFQSAKEQIQILEDLAQHKIDIIIGTHRLLQKDLDFSKLGLLIIDEEHRFGVKQKERLKALRAEVDILTLTATPIPRTLNMAMSGMRDLSIISTPPARRLAVKTFIQEKNNDITTEAITREIMRGGQVYYLHNNVSTIERTTEQLRALIPELKIAFAHGQMRERDLETIMRDFHHHRFNVLVCTTIIESGIDIPTANTIIIDRADHFGLAQLHQLRGRVGRSHHQAYAYLLVPNKKLMTADAVKRLDALASLEDLGAGFLLATHDLEIRGAGELLGEEQSGHINAIGFPLYMELLERAVKTIESGEPLDAEISAGVSEVELAIPAHIPDQLIGDVHLRLILYKRIASSKDQRALDDIQVEMIDRFGLLPGPCKHLFQISGLKNVCEAQGIKKIKANVKDGMMEFTDKPKIDLEKLIKLVQVKPKSFKFEAPNKLRFYFSEPVVASELADQITGIIDSIL